jgi:hypothetical protein
VINTNTPAAIAPAMGNPSSPTSFKKSIHSPRCVNIYLINIVMENALFFVNKKKDQHPLPLPGEIIEIRLWKKYTHRSNILFYYSIYDMHSLNFLNFADSEMKNFLRRNLNSKIVFDNTRELIDHIDILEINQAAESWVLNENQIVFLCSDEIQKKFVEDTVNSYYVQTICLNTFLQDLFQNKKKSFYYMSNRYKKFSMLCRRHRPWRTYLFSKLVDSKLINEFRFSYHGVDNECKLTDKDIISDTESTTNKKLTTKFKEILKNRPFHDNTDNKNVYTEISNLVYMSDIHVTIEHDRNDELGYDPIIPGHTFVSEKTYKPIIAKKPFIMFSEPGFLKVLRQMGFKTFHPFINEDYDNILGYEVRIGEIIKEIRRITRLKKQDYENLLEQCQPIVKHNYKVAKKLAKRHSWENVWKQLY